MNNKAIDILQAALWGNSTFQIENITEDIFQELSDHALAALVYDVVENCKMDNMLRRKWMGRYASQIATFNSYMEEYHKISLLLQARKYIPVVLKGLSAAMYYPEPAYRAVGDIDFMVFPRGEKELNNITELLQANGYTFVPEDYERHLNFQKNGLSYEMHRYFSKRQTSGEIILDEIIWNSTPVEKAFQKWSDYRFYSFPDEINGLIFLQHINQHLISGLGLRQIIDWLFFVEAVVSDEFWTETLQPLTDRTGLTRLAITVTKMCEIYLGEPKHSWAQKADIDACNELFRIVDESGNFGQKRSLKDNKVTTVLNQKIGGIRGLQVRGLSHWKAAQKHKVLRPFAWIYQICRYIKEGLIKRDPNSEGLLKSYKRHREQKKLFKKLGLWQYRK